MKKTEGRKSRDTVPLNGQSHEKVGEIMIWNVSFGLNYKVHQQLFFLNFKIAHLKATIFLRGALDVKPVSLIWRILLHEPRDLLENLPTSRVSDLALLSSEVKACAFKSSRFSK
jgi:hypothetical protein